MKVALSEMNSDHRKQFFVSFLDHRTADDMRIKLQERSLRM